MSTLGIFDGVVSSLFEGDADSVWIVLPPFVVVSLSIVQFSPASKLETRACGNEDTGSHVVSVMGLPSHAT